MRLLLISLLVLLSGCASVRSRMARINPGMDKAEVIAIMGNPGDRQFNGNLEAMQWCSTGNFSDDYVIVWLRDGKVTGMNSYNNTVAGMCSGHYRTVRWEDAPMHP